MASRNAPRPRWTQRELDLLRELYPRQHTRDVAAAIGRPAGNCYRKAAELGIRKAPEWISQVARMRTAEPGHGSHAARFTPGAAPWNKGLKGSTGLHPKSVANHFKPGSRHGRAAANVLPVGSLRITEDGILQRKVAGTVGALYRNWVAVHRLVWERAHGPVPPGHIVVFRPGRHSTKLKEITVDALELITRAENMRRNSSHTRLSPELARLVQLRGALNRMINQRTKKDAE
ncbi:MAG: HNH endonuclease [Burkholderiaceae bacterium]|jgi:hypothetical protein|nr:HNH endonuclease [Burkholderiaceae bacterium]